MILEFDISYLYVYGFALTALCSFIPVCGAGIWHILKMIN